MLIALDGSLFRNLAVLLHFNLRSRTFTGLGFINCARLSGQILLILLVQFALIHFSSNVLILNLHIPLLCSLVGFLLLFRGKTVDLLNALGIQNVIRIMILTGSLLQIVNRHVLQHVAIQIFSNFIPHQISKFRPLNIQVGKIHLFACCL